MAPIHAELTSQQAADLLNVSRPYLIKMLENKEIPYRRVGNRRRIRLSDLINYKRNSEESRRRVFRDLTRDAQDMGLGYA
ncbi:MAG: excisionase family DNA-binding protein [bacterium]|nr:excisionase family DNA-binding protein [bacterium]